MIHCPTLSALKEFIIKLAARIFNKWGTEENEEKIRELENRIKSLEKQARKAKELKEFQNRNRK